MEYNDFYAVVPTSLIMPGRRTCPECGGGEVADEIDRSELERALENAERDYRNLNPRALSTGDRRVCICRAAIRAAFCISIPFPLS